MTQTTPKRVYNPFRTSFNRLPLADQLRVIKFASQANDVLTEIVNIFVKVNPSISIRKDGRITLLTDKHHFPKFN